MITASQIIKAIEGGDLDCVRHKGYLIITIERQAILTVSEKPVPRVTKTPDNAVKVMSGDTIIVKIQAASPNDATEIAAVLGGLLV